jgi:hypothetical protein
MAFFIIASLVFLLVFVVAFFDGVEASEQNKKHTALNRLYIPYKPNKQKAYKWEKKVVLDTSTFANPYDKHAVAQEQMEWHTQRMEGATGAIHVRKSFEKIQKEWNKQKRQHNVHVKLRDGQDSFIPFHMVEKKFVSQYNKLMGTNHTTMPVFRYVLPYVVEEQDMERQLGQAMQEALFALAQPQGARTQNTIPTPRDSYRAQHDQLLGEKRQRQYEYMLGDGKTMVTSVPLSAHDQQLLDVTSYRTAVRG